MNFVDGKTTSLDELEIYLEKAMAMIADLNGKVVVFGSGKCRTCPPEVKYLDAYETVSYTHLSIIRHSLMVCLRRYKGANFKLASTNQRTNKYPPANKREAQHSSHT